MNQTLGFDLKVDKSERGITIEHLGATAKFVIIRNKCGARLSLPREDSKGFGRNRGDLAKKEAFSAQTQKLVGKLNFVLSAVTGKVGRVALRPQRNGDERRRRSLG